MSAFLFFTALLLNIGMLSAEEVDISKPLRIHQLMPRKGMFVSLAIEPALPNDFIALSQGEEINYSDWVYWGPEKAVKAYFEDPSSLKFPREPIIRIRIAQSITQEKDGILDTHLIKQNAMELGVKDLKLDSGKWKDLPYCIISGVVANIKLHMAYVGCNEDGIVFLFNLLVPNDPKEEPRALALWNRFFKETEYLPEPLAIKAQGQEMYLGYTVQDVVGCKVKVMAERRKSDKKIRFMCIPEDPRVKFTFDEAFSTRMGFDWHHGDPLLKIKGTYIVDNGWVNYSTTTSIFIKEVEDFTSVPLLKANVFFKTL